MDAASDKDEELKALREAIAEANGFQLFKKYDERASAEFIGIHYQTLKTHRGNGDIAFIRLGRRSIAYFGFQIADFLIGSIQWQTEKNPSSNLASVGSARAAAPTCSTDTGGMPTEAAPAALRLARQTLKKPKKN